MTAQSTMSGEWEYPLVDEALDTAAIWPIKEYIQRRQATVAVKVACRIIYELYIGAEKIPGSSRFMRWWDWDLGRKVE